ncbi:MOSC domain-containing protein [Granulicoccus sp. GXG6511]|uniref:MOSC domain-containing protein n=1 Tax=Granulicoccus sp. GXG6511 TaxID=3381351 RepID=UPI003D7D380A
MLDAVFVGTPAPLAPEGQLSAIVKHPVGGAVRVDADGLTGDQQGDLRVHGGPEKAVHLYPPENYALLAAARPELAGQLRPGVLGENLSAPGLTESAVCIGDIYRIGTVRLQVSQPRRPCWKIDHRLDSPGLNQVVVKLGCPGWYARVLTPGELAAGDPVSLDDRPAPDMTLARLLATDRDHRPAPDELRALAAAPGLNDDWRARLLRRAEWLLSRSS